MKPDITNFTVRPFEPTDLDYAAAVKLANQYWPNHPSTVEVWKDNDNKRNPKHLNRRYIGEIEHKNGKQIVALGIIDKRGLAKEPGKYYIGFYIDQEFEDQGLGEPLYTHMLTDLADKNPVELKNNTQANNAPLIELLQEKGFQQSRWLKRYSELDVSSFKFDLFAGYSEKVAAAGIAIVSLKELQTRDSNWIQKLYDLDSAIRPDINEEFEEYAKTFERVYFRADAWFVAVDGDNYVGQSGLWINLVREGLFDVATTSVLPSYRRRGIATALKLKTIAFAQACSANSNIETRNVENDPMYTLNTKLGFKPQPVWLTFKKVL